ncbi:MAG: PIG-L family deacetylase [Verrucomicrobiota bacterium]
MSKLMKFHQNHAQIYVPDDMPLPAALSRVTHLGIGAHADDLEFMALHGIAECYQRTEHWFGGITCTDGAGCSRSGAFENITDVEMVEIRAHEQNAAAQLGAYGVMVQLAYPSHAIRKSDENSLQQDLLQLLNATTPEVVYTHNPADRHATHISVMRSAIQVIREIPSEQRPRKVIGCEVWRDLDWLPDDLKVVMDVSGHDQLAGALNAVFKSQIAGGKRYDLAIAGRRSAHATFCDAHTSDSATQLIFGMDLTPVVTGNSMDLADYVEEVLDKFRQEVMCQLNI